MERHCEPAQYKLLTKGRKAPFLMKNSIKFQVHEANQYRPTLIQSDVELLLKVLDFYATRHPHPRRAIEMASNIRNHWRPVD